MSVEQKAKKAAANKAYRERKKMKSQNWMELEKFEMSFEHKFDFSKTLNWKSQIPIVQVQELPSPSLASKMRIIKLFSE